MSKRKCVNELSIMKKDMQKHLKKDMKNEMIRYKDDKDEIRRMVRGGTLVTNYKGPGRTKRNINYDNDKNNLITFDDIMNNVKTKYEPNYIYLQKEYNAGNLEPDENIAFDEATTYLNLKSPETKNQFIIDYKQKQEHRKKEYDEMKKQQMELQEDREHNEEKKKAITPYDIFEDERFTNIGNKGTCIPANHKKFELYVLIPQVRQSLKLTDRFEPFLDHKTKIHGDINTVGNIMDNYKADKSMASFDFYQKGSNGGKNLFIDTKFYNNDNRGKYKMLNQTGVQDLIKAYDKTYKQEKDIYDVKNEIYEGLTDENKKEFDIQKKDFDKWFHNSKKFEHFIPLTVAKIKGSSDGATLVKWIGDKITVETKAYKIDLFNKEDYADDVKFILSYSDGVYEVNIKELPFFNNEKKELDLGLSKDGKEYKLPPKYLKFIKKFI
jgi:hypothetical protein